MRTTGGRAKIQAYLATCAKALGLPRPGTETGKGPWPSNVPQRRSLGMRTVTDLDGNDVTYEAWETLHGAHVPFTTVAWDKPRKHPTKKMWDCEALDPDDARMPMTVSERTELLAKFAAAKPAGDDWTAATIVPTIAPR